MSAAGSWTTGNCGAKAGASHSNTELEQLEESEESLSLKSVKNESISTSLPYRAA